MRILYFSRDYTPHDHRFLSALAETQHEVFYLRLEKRSHQLENRPLPKGVNPVSWVGGKSPAKLSNSLRLLKGLRKVLREIKPDVLHAGPIQTVALLAALSGFQPLVTMSWGSDLLLDADKNLFYRWATRFVFKRSTVLIGDCDAVRAKAINLGFQNDRIITFPWGIDLKQFSPGEMGQARKRAGWEDNFVILHTRSWEDVYGVDILAQAFILAFRQQPTLRMFMLGGGSLAAKLNHMLEAAGIKENILFPGQVAYQELPDYYNSADLYISTSHSDGSSVSLMEALASGLPAVVSDIPGNREWVTPQENGDWFPDGNSEVLAQTILDLVEHREKLPAMSLAARKTAELRANWPENSKRLLDVYQMAVNYAE